MSCLPVPGRFRPGIPERYLARTIRESTVIATRSSVLVTSCSACIPRSGPSRFSKPLAIAPGTSSGYVDFIPKGDIWLIRLVSSLAKNVIGFGLRKSPSSRHFQSMTPALPQTILSGHVGFIITLPNRGETHFAPGSRDSSTASTPLG